MRQERINATRRRDRDYLEPLPPDARDPDIIRANRIRDAQHGEQATTAAQMIVAAETEE